MRARRRCAVSHGQSGSGRKVFGLEFDAHSGGIASEVGLNDGHSVSAVEKVINAGLAEISESDLSISLLSSSDFADSIFEQGGARFLPPSRKSISSSVSDSASDSLTVFSSANTRR